MHPVLIHKMVLFIFISTIIVIERVLDDKNAHTIHFVSCIIQLVTLNQYMESLLYSYSSIIGEDQLSGT